MLVTSRKSWALFGEKKVCACVASKLVAFAVCCDSFGAIVGDIILWLNIMQLNVKVTV